MSYKLIIVESPAKCVKIETYVGEGYKCVASFGHIRELDSSFVNKVTTIDKKFKPEYVLMESKKQQISKLRKMIAEASEVYLASDDDREGEAIAWHICDTFKLPIKDTKRIVFHEITQTALKRALLEPRRINMNLVYAQQSRQVLDMIVGYKLSPILWKHISQHKKAGLSAGRCQTPALRIVYDNQIEINTSPTKKVYTTTGYFTSKNLEFTLNYQHESEEEMSDFLERSLNHEHVYQCEKVRNVTKKAPIPFTTSGLQQMASSELRISPKDTMSACQKLYEGGYITYMRTDSVTYSDEFIKKAEKYITKKYGEKFFRVVPSEERVDTSADDENDVSAHEAIRPTNVELEEVDKEIGNKEVRIYKLIRRNTLESCMADATYKGVTATLKGAAPLAEIQNDRGLKGTEHQNDRGLKGTEHKNERGLKGAAPLAAPLAEPLTFRYSTEQVVFPGWKAVDGYEKESPTFTYLQTLKSGAIIPYKKIVSKVGIKNSKSHYTEAALVQLLEKHGIGRPSTFASLVEVIQEREYVNKEDVKGKMVECIDFTLEGEELLENKVTREMGNEKGKMVIQPTGTIVLEFLLKHFDKLFKYEYTKQMEDELDLIAKGKKNWYDLCNDCLREIAELSSKLTDENKDDTTIKIDKYHTYMIGRYGPVVKCISSDDKKTVTFKPVKPDLDIERLKSGKYTLEDILSTEPKMEMKELGKYNDTPIYLKKGQYGYYIEWRDIRKSIEVAEEMTLDAAIELLSKNESTNLTIVRKIDDHTSIRTGKFGDYIFHKKPTWKKPQFLKLDGFVNDNKTEDGKEISYRTCDISVLSKWVYTKYKL